MPLIDALGAGWWTFHDTFVAPIPYVHSNPFVCTLWAHSECPAFTPGAFSIWSYMASLAVGGPVMSLLQAYAIAKLTGEFKDRPDKGRREATITAFVLFFTAPFLAISYKLQLEGNYGKVYHGWGETTMGSALVELEAGLSKDQKAVLARKQNEITAARRQKAPHALARGVSAWQANLDQGEMAKLA